MFTFARYGFFINPSVYQFSSHATADTPLINIQQQALEMQKQLQQQSDNGSFQAEQDDLEAEPGL